MDLFARQIRTLLYKNLLVAAIRRPILTTIRALIIPLLIALVLSYAQYFLNPAQQFGVGRATPVYPLSTAISKASSGRNTVVFVDNGLTGGDIGVVIDEVAAPFRSAGKQVVVLHNESETQSVCQTSQKGSSKCFGAIVFTSSITQPTMGGTWNYTLRADSSLGTTVNVDSPNNDAQIYLLPLQRAVDTAIARHSQDGKPDALGRVNQYTYTVKSEQSRRADTRQSYLDSGISYFGVVFFFAMVGVVYHLTGFMAAERERGLSQLVDAMMPNVARWQPQVARLLACHGAFSIIYFPSWLATGTILSAVVFTHSNAAIIIFYHITSGLALTSYAIVGAAFFRKEQVSGIVMALIAVILAVLPQVLDPTKQTNTTVLALSLIFPSSNYVYFSTFVSYWEAAELPVTLTKPAPTSDGAMPPWTIHGATLWCFLIIQIVIYPLAGAIVERVLFSTHSSARRMNLENEKAGLGPTLRMEKFSKVYKQNVFMRTLWKKKADVHAVKNLTLDARKGEILMLLGPNGSGKSTTLDAVASLSKISSGSIDIDGRGGIGVAPQNNVLWDDLTVEEHVRILYWVKTARTQNSKSDIVDLIHSCDLAQKANDRSKTLSGGQKRKLQLAMMFAGGSAVCCLDEVTSGLDPLSRRKIWDILLAERSDRTMIMTTHFLDEADFLADHIAILSKGALVAEGSSAGLKQRLGDGYSIHVHAKVTNLPLFDGIEQKDGLDGTTYTVPDGGTAAYVIDCLERSGVDGPKISGPTLEDLFLKLTGTYINSLPNSEGSRDPEVTPSTDREAGVLTGIHLTSGSYVGPWRQLSTLFHKRWIILGHNYMPYVGAIIVALIGAGVTPLLLGHYTGTKCDPPSDGRSFGSGSFGTEDYRESFATISRANLVAGPSTTLTQETIASLANIYSSNRTAFGEGSITNTAQLISYFSEAASLADFGQMVAAGVGTITPGGFWLGDNSSNPAIAWGFTDTDISHPIMVQNLLNNFLTGLPIATAYSNLSIPPSPTLYDFDPLIFSIYIGLVFSCYPAFFAIYPTAERLRKVRALHYSNGVRSIPLWLAYLCFDGLFVLLISAISVALIAAKGSYWYHAPYLFLVLFLYGISSTLMSYILSLISRSGLAAWAFSASVQVVFCLGYIFAYLGVQSNVNITELPSTLNKIHFTLGIISPVANLLRACFVALNQLALLCGNTSYPGAIELYGGPILLLVIQIFGFLGILLWGDSQSSLFSILRGRQEQTHAAKGEKPALPEDVLEEVARVTQFQDSGLRVSHLSKNFRKTKAVDDVTFGVEQGEVFALLGPNGAGKSTAISLIRGDIKSSNSGGEILINGLSMDNNRNLARSQLGVCPQFDACDTLTVKQQLLFYARVRGVASPSQNTEELIRAFGLETFRDRLAQKLSGGTKRKLSLAIALIGNPPVLLLDEPSSGLDPTSKRLMWRTLSSLSPGRSTVLTTHSMEEADALAHRAGIMAGRMLTLGSVEYLRNRWGNVYHVHLVAKSAPYTTLGEVEKLRAWVRGNVEGAEVEEKTYCGQVRFTVPARGEGQGEDKRRGGIGRLFRLLDENKRELGVEYYSVGQTTMDEVFVKIVRQHGGKEENS